MPGLLIPTAPQGATVAKHKTGAEPRSAGRPAIGKQVNIRIPAGLLEELELIGEAKGLDLSNVIRMILTEKTPAYLEEARDVIGKRQHNKQRRADD